MARYQPCNNNNINNNNKQSAKNDFSLILNSMTLKFWKNTGIQNFTGLWPLLNNVPIKKVSFKSPELSWRSRDCDDRKNTSRIVLCSHVKSTDTQQNFGLSVICVIVHNTSCYLYTIQVEHNAVMMS